MRFMHTLVSLSAFAIALSVAAEASAQARTFVIDEQSCQAKAEDKKQGKPCQVQFVSDAPLEKFTGTTTNVTGELSVDPGKLATGKGEVKVDVASIKTGVELRDEHLHGSDWLDAKANPKATFVITKISGADKLKPNEAVEVTVQGTFTIHGKSKALTTTAKVRWIPAGADASEKSDTLRIQSSFMVKLKEHEVSINPMVALKVAPEVKVNVDLRARAK